MTAASRTAENLSRTSFTLRPINHSPYNAKSTPA
jgi:hypothetical protein